MKDTITVRKRGNDVFIGNSLVYPDETFIIQGIGTLNVRDTTKAGLHLAVFHGETFKYSLSLLRDGEYKIGSEFGHRIKGEADKQKILKNLIRKMNIPVNVLNFNLEQYRVKLKQPTELEEIGDYNEYIVTDGDIIVEPNGSSQIITIKAGTYLYVLKYMKILSRDHFIKNIITEINISNKIHKHDLEKVIYKTLRN